MENIKENFEREEDIVANDVDELMQEFKDDYPKYDVKWIQETDPSIWE